MIQYVITRTQSQYTVEQARYIYNDIGICQTDFDIVFFYVYLVCIYPVASSFCISNGKYVSIIMNNLLIFGLL